MFRLWAFGAVAILVSCSSGPVGSDEQVDRPFDALFTLTQDDQRLLYQAEKQLIQECMQTAGFDYPIPPFTTEGIPDRPYGLADENVARRFGYGLESLGPTEDVLDQYIASLSPSKQESFYDALFGNSGDMSIRLPSGMLITGPGGCTGLADEAVRGDRSAYHELSFTFQELRGQARQEAALDDRVVAALAQWSDCMRDRGFDYLTPSDAMNAVAGRPSASETPVPGPSESGDVGGSPRDLEIQVAVADVQCKVDSDLVKIWASVEAELQREMSDEHEAELVVFAEMRAAALERARAIVESQS